MEAFVKLLLIAFILTAGCQSDLITKRMAEDTLKNKSAIPVVEGYVELRYTENRNLSFGMLSFLPDNIKAPTLIAIQVLSSLAVAVLIFSARKRSVAVLLPFLLILSGAIGNVVDRIRYGYVVDFIHVHIKDTFSWPIFNIADVLIAVGIGLFLFQILFLKIEPLIPMKAQNPENPA